MWKMIWKENGLVVEFGSRRKLLAGGRCGTKAAAGGRGVGGSGGGRRSRSCRRKRRSASLPSELRLSRQKTAERASKSGTVCNSEMQIATRSRWGAGVVSRALDVADSPHVFSVLEKEYKLQPTRSYALVQENIRDEEGSSCPGQLTSGKHGTAASSHTPWAPLGGMELCSGWAPGEFWGNQHPIAMLDIFLPFTVLHIPIINTYTFGSFLKVHLGRHEPWEIWRRQDKSWCRPRWLVKASRFPCCVLLALSWNTAGGGNCIKGVVKCLSSYFTQEWAFWTNSFCRISMSSDWIRVRSQKITNRGGCHLP